MTDVALGGELAQLAAEYEILGELGRGGSAVVYHGRDRGLGRDVAIKVVHPRPLSPTDDAVARLAREARTVAQLQHPNIVTVYAVRSLAGGGLALVMQLVPGRTLKQMVLQDGPFPPDRCERVLRDVASALAYAHARGVIHRDVKPENIFVDEESGRALLSDFGIARSDETESMTLTGTAIGTPFYMSPEQIDGGAVDGRSDLYSLGVVAWELLTGRRPWDGESLYNVIYKQKHEELPPIEAIRPGVPTRLQYIVERMLQKNRAARWAGAEGLLVQLSHTVLPGDYGRWQATLRRRVEKYQLAERERAVAEQPETEAAGLFASTIRFVRSATGGGPARRKGAEPASPAGLADTMTVPRDGMLPSPSGAVATLDEPAAVAAVDDEAVEPTWALPSRAPRARRWVLAAAGALAAATLVAIGAVRSRGTQFAMFEPTGRDRDNGTAIAPTPVGRASTTPGIDTLTGALPASIPASAPGAGAVAVSSSPTRLALGGRHSCAVAVDGSIQCWGANERGQLGDGTAQRQVAPAHVAAELTFAGVSAGTLHSCGVTRTGDVYCWGNDTFGQLGDATTVRRNAPVRVAGHGVYRTVSAGDSHTCAVTLQDAVHCWGANGRGQLGDGGTRLRTTPTPVAAPDDRTRFAQVVSGAAHSCALTVDGEAFCWGANERGQLGVGVAGDRRVPTRVAGDFRFVALATGQQHTCGVTAKGVVACWGANARGQVGGGARAGSTSPQVVRLPFPATAIAAGAQHSCAIVATGEVFCWGANSAGQLGNGTVSDASAPTRAATAEPFTALAAGGAHTCGVGASGALVCWGSNAEGQLGDATRISHESPTRIAIADAAITRPPAR